MADNINSNQTDAKEVAERTFTQDEVNRIVADRLARDREKRTSDLDEREKAIKDRELAVVAAEKLADAGLPKDLCAVLKYDDEASIDTAISALAKMSSFTNGTEQSAAKQEKRNYIENKLPEQSEHADGFDSMIRNAFRPHTE